MRASTRSRAQVLAIVALLASPAAAAPNDSAATRLADQAMTRHFPATEFDAAKAKLEKAISRCESGCSPAVRARLHRDLGVVMITGFSDDETGEREFALALAADPSIELDPVYTTPEVQAAFERAAKQASRRKPHRKHRKHPQRDKKAEALEHEPVTEQRVRTPIPIYVEPADPESVAAGELNFKRSEGPWQKIALKAMGGGFGAEIPCSAVRATGTLSYYVELKDPLGEVVSSAGSRAEPLEIEIADEEPDEPPHFPRQHAPPRCGAPGGACEEDIDCKGQATCQANRCVARGPSSVWLGLGIAQDVALISGSDVCTKESQLERGFACFRASGSQYHGAPQVGEADAIESGFALATTRALLISHLRLSSALSVGLVIGVAFRGGGPQPDGGKAFLPAHAELRGEWWPGGEPLPSEVAPFLLISGGVAQIDASRSVTVFEDRSVPPPPNQIDNPDSQQLNAFKKMGASFAAGGGGVYLPFGAGSGLLVDLKALILFPDSGLAAEGEASYVIAL